MMAQSRIWRKVMVLFSCQVVLVRDELAEDDDDAYLIFFVDD